MLSFIKKLFGGSTAPATEAPYKVETPVPAGTEATIASPETITDANSASTSSTVVTEQRYVGENEQGAVYETVVVVPEAVVPAAVVEAAPAKKPRAKKPAAPKAPKAPKAPRAPKAK